MGAFAPTHRSPTAGLDTWPDPDASRPRGPRIDADLPVQEVQRWGDWARVACSNGWEAWVDARQLAPLGAGAGLDTSPVRIGGRAFTLPLVGAAVALVSCFLPWISPAGQGTTSFRIPVKFLLDYEVQTLDGPKVGWLVAALAVVGALPLGPTVRKVGGWGLVVVASVFLAQTQRLVGQLQLGNVFGTLGLGVYLAAAGGLLVALSKDHS